MKTGFVYLWRDRARKMFYIGSHFGALTDRYVSSSVRLNHAYQHRAEDFTRRILYYSQDCTVAVLQAEEQRWLDLIPPTDLGVRYYNLKRKAAGGRGSGFVVPMSTRQKISQTKRGRPQSAEHRARIAASIQQWWHTGHQSQKLRSPSGLYLPKVGL